MADSFPTRRFFAASAAAFITLAARVPAAMAGGWEFLGSRSVRMAGDVDVIPVSAAEGKFKAVQLRVEKNGIFVHDMRITFGNGDKKDVPLRFHIPEGGQSRRIDLPGRARFIRSVRLTYRSVPDNDGRARVELWGFQ